MTFLYNHSPTQELTDPHICQMLTYSFANRGCIGGTKCIGVMKVVSGVKLDIYYNYSIK